MTAVDPSCAQAWVRTSLELSLAALEGLVELACRGAAPAVVPVIRDMADHVGLWAEEVAWQDDAHAEVDAEAAAYVARVARGLLARFEATDAIRPAQVRRTAAACAADLDTHLARADALLRRHERGGNGSRLQQIRSRLPSAREFLRAG